MMVSMPAPLLPALLGASAAHAAPPLPLALAHLSAPMQASVQLPGTGVQMLELEDRVAYIAGNGRYVFTGAAWDLWHGEQLESVAQATALGERIDPSRLVLDPDELGALRFNAEAVADADADADDAAGQGEAATWVFVDPRCADCVALLHTLERADIPANVVLLPVDGEKSAHAARRILCAPSDAAARAALLEQTADALPEPAADCDTQPLVRALVTARLLGIASVPTLIAPDGRLHRGAPADLSSWLAEK
jgi:thiol:disulfide interchange protein DsbC